MTRVWRSVESGVLGVCSRSLPEAEVAAAASPNSAPLTRQARRSMTHAIVADESAGRRVGRQAPAGWTLSA